METGELLCSPPPIIMFKSYYVVWKQNSKGEVVGDADTFKSYYVVWKLGARKKKNDAEKRLNRTM